MGCGCNRKRYTRADPLVLGEPTGPVMHVVPTITVSGTRRGEKTWVQGSSVQAMIDAGWFHLLSTV